MKQISKDDEQGIFDYMARNQVYNVDAAYSAMFYQRDVDAAREAATKNTAEHMANNRNTYAAPPKGGTPSTKAPDMSKMSQEERDAATLDALKSLEMFKGPY
jgi:hypothetical protein